MGDSDDYQLDDWAHTFLRGLRRSTELAEKLLSLNETQSSRIRELEDSVAAAEAKAKALEERLSASLRETQSHQVSELMQEQNCLIHTFVASDRLMRSRSAREVLDTTAEILANFAGVVRYGLWLRWDDGPALVLARPVDAGDSLRNLKPAVERILSQGLVEARSDQELPLFIPLKLNERLVGVLAIEEFGQQVNEVGPLQRDLLNLLTERCSASLCVGALWGEARDEKVWGMVRERLEAEQGRRQ
jgi:hypothetical protein